VRKKKINTSIPNGYIDLYDFEGPIEHVTKLLTNKQKEAIAQGYEYITIQPDFDCGGCCHGAQLKGTRLETDEEFEKRKKDVKKERKRKEAMKTKRYEEYLKLKKEFEI
jgi:hypothetical protein